MLLELAEAFLQGPLLNIDWKSMENAPGASWILQVSPIVNPHWKSMENAAGDPWANHFTFLQ